MRIKYFLIGLLLFCVVNLEAKKLSKSRNSGRSSNRKTYSQPAPTSQTAPKPTLFGWQEKPAQRSQSTGSRQNKPKQTQTHSYPSSQTGLSGKPASSPQGWQEKPAQSYPQNNARSTNNQPQQSSGNSQSNVNHGYPSSNSMSGSGTGASYPSQQGGLSGNAQKQPPSYQESVQKSNANQQNHGYPNSPSNPNQQSHAYPANHGMSGNSGTGYPAQAPPPQYSSNSHQGGYANNYNRAPPPPYPGNYGSPGGYGGYGGHGGYGGYNVGPQMPGYFGNYGNSGRGFGGMRTGSALTGVGIAGAGVGTLITGLALWNLARSTGNRHHTVIYDNRGQPVAVAPPDNSSGVDPILGELVNCTLTVSSINATEVLAIPCAIATSFTPDADVKDTSVVNNNNSNTTCTVTVVNKASREFSTTIPCSLLLNSAAENNVTEPPESYANGTNEFDFGNNTNLVPPNTEVPAVPAVTGLPESQNNQTLDKLLTTIDNNNSSLPDNCTLFEPGLVRDPINPCFAVTGDVTVQPLPIQDETSQSTPS